MSLSTKIKDTMSTRALIIRREPVTGKFQYGQTHWDGYANTVWLNKHMRDEKKVEDFFNQLVKGEPDKYGNTGRGIASLKYEKIKTGEGFLNYEYDESKPIINWYDDSYNCGESEELPVDRNIGLHDYFDFPEYVSIWHDGIWHDICVDNPIQMDRFWYWIDNNNMR